LPLTGNNQSNQVKVVVNYSANEPSVINQNIDVLRTWIGGHCLPKDTIMFLQSSSSGRRSKILTAAMEVDGDYRTFRTKLDRRIIPTSTEGNAIILKKK
jgi:hypothetical protein